MADCMGASSSSDIVVRTVDDVMVENGHKATNIMSNLTNIIQVKKRRLEAMEFKYKETREAISNLVNQNDELHQSYSQEMKEMQSSIQKHFQWICSDNATMNSKLEMEEKELELRSIEVQKREAINESKRKKIAKEIEENAASNNLKLLKLADDHKREMEKLHKKIYFLKKQMEVGINQDVYEAMKRSLGALIAMFHKDAVDVLEEMQTDLNERAEELDELNGITLALRELEQKKNDELTDACKELTEGLRGLPNAYKIRVKRMGELEKTPFYSVMKQKYNEEEALSRADTEYRLWNDYLRDRTWYPFRVITTIDGNLQVHIYLVNILFIPKVGQPPRLNATSAGFTATTSRTTATSLQQIDEDGFITYKRRTRKPKQVGQEQHQPSVRKGVVIGQKKPKVIWQPRDPKDKSKRHAEYPPAISSDSPPIRSQRQHMLIRLGLVKPYRWKLVTSLVACVVSTQRRTTYTVDLKGYIHQLQHQWLNQRFRYFEKIS